MGLGRGFAGRSSMLTQQESQRVAPLHAHVLGQLALAQERESQVNDAVATRLGTEAEDALRRTRDAHPCDIPSLESLASSSSAHSLLAEAIGRSHRREAASWACLLEGWGDEAEVLLRVAADHHGKQTGERLARRGQEGPAAVQETIAAAVLENMPCRTNAKVIATDTAMTTGSLEAL